jgi:hypothetical protein
MQWVNINDGDILILNHTHDPRIERTCVDRFRRPPAAVQAHRQGLDNYPN